MRRRLAVVGLALLALTAARQSSPSCDTADACTQLAYAAASRGEFEAFHDYAWLAVRKGRANDRDLMYLLARAQSLSGRPHDALVMLRRLAGMGVATDADTHADFTRVRALAGWPELAALIAAARDKTAPSPPAPPAAAPPAVGTSSTPAPKTAEPLTVARRSFAPVGLAYDSVSRRFIAGDRHANKLIVLDEEFRRVNDLAAAASAGFFGLTAVEIDRRRGDLWVANARDDGSHTALHRLQLVSGRVLDVWKLPAEHGAAAFGDITLTPSGTVLALDTLGKRVFPHRNGHYLRPVPLQSETVRSIATLDDQTACVATSEGLLRVDFASRKASAIRADRGVRLAGFIHIRASRGSLVGIRRDGDNSQVIRVVLGDAGARAVSAELVADVAIADATSMSVDGDTLHYLARDPDGGTTVRHVSLRRQ